jgi:hypothetical protein
MRSEALRYASEWSDVAMAGRLAALYQQLAATNISTNTLSTVSA